VRSLGGRQRRPDRGHERTLPYRPCARPECRGTRRKWMRRLLAVLAGVMMVVGLAAPAWAENAQKSTTDHPVSVMAHGWHHHGWHHGDHDYYRHRHHRYRYDHDYYYRHHRYDDDDDDYYYDGYYYDGYYDDCGYYRHHYYRHHYDCY